MDKNIIWACALSFLILIGWDRLYEAPKQQAIKESTQQSSQNDAIDIDDHVQYKYHDAQEIINNTKDSRVFVNSNKLSGSINLVGARIDDISLAKYKETTDENSKDVVLFSPEATENMYLMEFGWTSTEENKKHLPNKNTVWKSNKNSLSNNESTSLTWTNDIGITFAIDISLDSDYMFTVKQSIKNAENADIYLQEYSRIMREKPKGGEYYMTSHEGIVGYYNNKFNEITYDKVQKKSKILIDIFSSNKKRGNNWIGFSDKYWASSIASKNSSINEGAYLKYSNVNNRNIFSAVETGGTHDMSDEHHKIHYAFVGAKEIDILDKYSNSHNISYFDKTIDFGWFYFITKPIFLLLQKLYNTLGNFGIAIMALTLIVKIAMLPLSYKSHVSMAKMKIIGPQMQTIKDRYANDKMSLNREMAALFKREKVNPAAGCLPIFVQIPIFFSLYKVFLITIEMRHTSFLWIYDLSSPDPLKILNLFGYLDYTINLPIPGIGILPIILGITMFLQQKSQPNTIQDPTQAKFMKCMPIIFVFVCDGLPAGLNLYWICNNILSILQQFMFNKISAHK